MKKFIPIFISAIFILVNVLSVDASENILRGININGNSEAYTIELASVKPARMTKNIVSANRIIINLKDISTTNNISTKYNSLVDNVIIEPNGNNLDILIQGDNIACSSIEFVEPNTLQQIQNIGNSAISTIAAFNNNVSNNIAIQFAVVIVLLSILGFEIRFIKQKYAELKSEKEFAQKDIENTQDFKNHLSGFGNVGLKKPYTTPIYGVTTNPAEMRKNYIKRMQTFKDATLNELMHNVNKEQVVIDKIINNKYSFGSLSKIDREKIIQNGATIAGVTTSPIQRSRLNANFQKIQDISAIYEKNSKLNNIRAEIKL